MLYVLSNEERILYSETPFFPRVLVLILYSETPFLKLLFSELVSESLLRHHDDVLCYVAVSEGLYKAVL